MDTEQIRSFIAIELPSALKNNIGKFQMGLKQSRWTFVKWVNPDLLHLTIKFLGNQSMARLDVVKEVLASCAASCRRFNLSTGQTGSFPGGNRVRVFWLGLEGDLDQLQSLVMAIENSLEKRGFVKESRSFTAHLTLARLRDECSLYEKKTFIEATKNLNFNPPCSFTVDHVVLMKSNLTPGGPIYTKIADYQLLV